MKPVFAAILARETHVDDPVGAGGLKIQVSLSYSDGFGREIQKKIQAEPGDVRGTAAGQRWVGSGWTIFNNKGRPVKQYEPFFAATHDFEFARQHGMSSTLIYDPMERVVATLHPDHTYAKVVFDPWMQEAWDVNDTVSGDPRTDVDIAGCAAGYFQQVAPEPAGWLTWLETRGVDPLHPPADTPGLDSGEKAAVRTLPHAETPTRAYFNPMGRTFLTIAHNKFERKKSGDTIETIEGKYPIHVILDIEGNQREVWDERTNAQGVREQRLVMRYDYDLPGSRVHQASMEAGGRWMLNDVTGEPVLSWDSRGHTFRTEYDGLRRPVKSFVTGADPADRGRKILFERTVYGEGHPEDFRRNLRGRVYLHLDQAGAATSELYDFKGNLLRAARRLAQDYKTAVNWQDVDAALPSDNKSKIALASLQDVLASWVESEIFTSATIYDALNRPIQMVAPYTDQANPKRINVIRPGYNEANLLERLDTWLNQSGEPSGLLDPATTPPSGHGVKNIDYNARGQRTRIEYRNSVTAAYSYDPDTFRLIGLRTTRPPGLNGLAPQLFANPVTVQDLHYTYDPAGNITNITDDAIPAVQYGNEQVGPGADYIYDAIYRLISAQGREHIGQTAFDLNQPDGNYRDYPFVGLRASANDPRAVRNYTESYDYDEAGNINSVRHSAMNGSWTRTYTYSEPSLLETGKNNNRLTRTDVGRVPETYSYKDARGNDVNGCMTGINSLRMTWDFKDQLQTVDLGGGGTAFYVYDASGRRVRKECVRPWQDQSQRLRPTSGCQPGAGDHRRCPGKEPHQG